MPAVTARDMAVFEALKDIWVETGCDEVVPNGIYWGDAPAGTGFPYCEFSSGGVQDAGNSNKTLYRDYPVQFKVNDLDQAAAGALVDEVANRLAEYLPALPVGEGRLTKVPRGPVTYLRNDEKSWSAVVQFTYGRNVPRTRRVVP